MTPDGQSRSKINWMAEFGDRSLESAYQEQELKASLRYAKWFILLCGVIFLLFYLSDLSHLSGALLIRSLMVRIAVVIIALIAFALSNKEKYAKFLSILTTVFVQALNICYIIMIFAQQSQDFYIQSMTVIVIIMGAFLVPTRWIYSCINSVVTVVLFLTIIPPNIHDMLPYTFVAVLAYLVLCMCGMAMAMWRVAFYRRSQFNRTQQYEMLSSTDALTGAVSRMKCDSVLISWCAQNKPFSLVIFDLDDFKLINDKFGHPIGDKVLIETVEIVKHSIRRDDIIGRWGGEEFLILFSSASLAVTCELTERIRKSIDEHRFPNDIHMTCSFGATEFNPKDTSYSIVKRADDLLYEAKHAGKNIVKHS